MKDNREDDFVFSSVDSPFKYKLSVKAYL